MCAGAGTSVSSRLSVKSSNHSGISRKRSSEFRLPCVLFFLFGFLVFVSHQFSCAASSLRSGAGRGDVLHKSCGGDGGDELAPALDDIPGTTRGTNLSVLQIKFLHLFGEPWFLTADPLTGISVYFAEFAKR